MKYDLHVHTTYSTHGIFRFDSVIKPKDAIRIAIQKGLDGIAITDHDTTKALKECRSYANNKLEIISGCEIASIQGHILAYGIVEWNEEKKDAFEVVEKIHELGGIAVAAHPFKSGLIKKGLQDFTKKLNLDGIEVLNYHLGKKENSMARKVAENMKIGMTAGTDAHILSDIGEVRTISDGDLIENIKNARTKVEGKEISWLKNFLTTTKRGILLTKNIVTREPF
jgi:hypothetical protein